MCFRCLRGGECSVIPLYFLCCSVNGAVCLVCCVSDSVCEFLGVVVILLLNVMEVLSVDGGALLDIPCMAFQRMCVLFL